MATFFAPGDRACLLDRAGDAVGDIREACATQSLDHWMRAMGHDKHRSVKWWLFAAGNLAAVHHAATHHVRASGGEGLGDDLRIRGLLAAFETEPLAPGHCVDHPPGDAHEARGFSPVH
jgi:hypothetical protein